MPKMLYFTLKIVLNRGFRDIKNGMSFMLHPVFVFILVF